MYIGLTLVWIVAVIEAPEQWRGYTMCVGRVRTPCQEIRNFFEGPT